MRVFVTGASGFVGDAIVKDLVAAGHQVLGLVRSDKGAGEVKAAGAEPLLGDVNNPEALQQGVTAADAVIHTAFNHDFSQYKASCEADRKVIETLGDLLVGTDKPLVITSGAGLLNLGRLATEDDRLTVGSNVVPRAASEEAAEVVLAKGVNVYTVRLPPSVHGAGDHGFVPMLIDIARQKGESVYIAEGDNQWPAVHRFDAATLYRLVIEQKPALKTLLAVAEEGIPFIEIARSIAQGLHIPAVSKTTEEAQAHFTWFAHFAAMGCPSSSRQTRQVLGWQPKEIGLLSDMESHYFTK